ncbi:MAG: M48 family metallopeptidase [Deltaproteobacteria bacterium]|nr:M48 family metallopeptidase [Deltaproteobacteria bacterium]MBW1737085.1 M48 family metallopeptidase [Deltaproteobacteria bacterium]MBW1909362.1 M48 family metallopeptidase [Deltaproteobacteria bacterium]MBW2033044.1 M48 family metallopeptidase [Deltaproteobacteria bacterium]MBW2114019.1 M48 family metallopeptidase [Deltaproteobacteria bacterium]
MKTGKMDGLEYTLKRSNRKSMGISIERDGTIMMTAPHHAELIDIEKFVSEKRIWIYQKLAQKKALNREGPKREFVNGQGFLYLGKSYRLKLIDGSGIKSGRSSKTAPLRLWHGYFELAETENAKARNHFISWYRKQIKKQLKERIPRYDKRIGVKVKDVRILDLGHRWASCGKNGSINFNWRSVMAPVWVFDYILVHEMVHMIERGHTDRFWSLVARVMPDYEEYALWLNENGADLDL